MIKVGVIGCGYWGPNLIRNFNAQPEVELSVIADLDENRLHQVGLLYPNTKKTTNYKEILEDSEIDAVVVATPMSTHFPPRDRGPGSGQAPVPGKTHGHHQ